MVEVIASGAAAAYLGLQACKAAGAAVSWRRQAKAPMPPLPPDWMADVALLQPILGGDPLLEQVLAVNLATLPHAHFVWLLDEDDPVGLATARALAATHAQRRITLHVSPAPPDGVNPKTFKLAGAIPGVAEGVVVVLDDDARLEATSLRRMVGDLARADLVTALPFYRDDGRPGARLMAQFVNNNSALTYLSLLPWLPPLSINGMCYALRTARLRGLGGFQPLLHQLADDLALARSLRAQGAVLHQSIAPVEVQTHTPTLRHYARQLHRWLLFATLLLRAEPARLRLLIVLLHGVPPLLLAALVAAAAADPRVAGPIALGVLALRAAMLCALQSGLSGRVRHRPASSVLAELAQPLHLLHAVLVRRIRWRTRTYRVKSNDDFHAV